MSERTQKDRAEGKRRLNQAISEETHRRLKIHAAERGVTVQQAIEELLRKALDLPQQPKPCSV